MSTTSNFSEVTGYCRSRTTVAKVSHLLRFSAGLPLSCPESQTAVCLPESQHRGPKKRRAIQKVGWKLRTPSDFVRKLPDFF